MNFSSLLAALLVFFFGTPLSIISGEYIIMFVGIPETVLFCFVIYLHYTHRYSMAIVAWHLTFCTATCIFGILLSEVIDVITMVPFLIFAPLFVLYKSPIRGVFLPVCLTLTGLAIAFMEVAKGVEILEPLPLKAYYWYFRPSTILTVSFLNIIVVLALFSEFDLLIRRLQRSRRKTERANKQIKKYAQELKSHAQELKLYAQFMTHELRSPLSALKAIADDMRTIENPEADLPALQVQISSGINHLLTVVSNAQALARIDAGRPPAIVHQNYDVRHMVTDLLNLFNASAKNRKLNLHLEISPDVPAQVNGDATALKQVLTNIISNALKFSKPGKSVNVNVSCDGSLLSIVVEDQGIGIAERELSKVFTKYYSTGEQNPNGTGLGLYISEQLVNFMGGSIAVESVRNVGSKFTICLPLQILAINPSVSDDESNNNFKVQVVDDNEASACLLGRQLEGLGCTVTFSYSAAEALDVALAFKPDLILLDFHLPDGDGPTLLLKMRTYPILSQTPVVMLSGDLPEESQLETYGTGVIDYLVKPVEKTRIKNILHSLRATAT